MIYHDLDGNSNLEIYSATKGGLYISATIIIFSRHVEVVAWIVRE
ncbi:hypothetical protein ACR77J_06330 [Tissierella praeacuta]